MKKFLQGSSRGFAAAGLMAVLVLALFGEALLAPGDRVASNERCDINMYFSASRSFGFGEIAEGNLPLWNPHVFSGSTFVGSFQSALFYPPNLVYVALPLAKAFNVDLALHVLLFGLLTFAWARGRGQANTAAMVAGCSAMFGSAFFMHVYAGHVTMLAGFAWAPLLFLAIDKTFEKGGMRWAALGSIAVTMQILAGLPQAVFVTGVAAAFYCLLRLAAHACRRSPDPAAPAGTIVFGLTLMAVAPFFLGAIQLWPGLEAARACARSLGVPADFATTFSFPPENLLMLLTPSVFGDGIHATYWGKWLFWEVSLYVGVVALMLSVYGLARGRGYWYFGPLLVVLTVIALGRYAPLYKWLHGAFPGFSSFRGPARFLTPLSLFLAMLAGAGMDRLLKLPRGRRWFALVPLLLALAMVVFAVWLRGAAVNPRWQDALVKAAHYVRYGNVRALSMKPDDVRALWIIAANQLGISALVLLALGLLWAVSGRFPVAAYTIAALAVGELLVFAWRHQAEFELGRKPLPALQHFEALYGEEGRIFHKRPLHPRLATASAFDIWGYEPVVDLRYAELFSHVMGIKRPVLKAGISSVFLYGAKPGPLARMLRLKATVESGNIVKGVATKAPALPRFLLLHQYEVARTFKDTFETMDAPRFNPAQTVILSADPDPVPAETGTGTVEVVETGTDHAVLEVVLDAPAILLNTDAYANGWRAFPIEKGPQDQYRLIRADYALRAIPLAAGHHRIRLVYLPDSFVAGRRASIASVTFLAVAAAYTLQRRKRNVKHP